MNEIVMPKLSDTMTEGRLVSWKKRVGDEVRRGEVIAEVETDKANMELEAYVSGVLLEIKVQAGEQADVGTVIALIGKPEEKGAAAGPPPAKEEPAAGEPQAEAAPVAPAAAAQAQQPPVTPEAGGGEKEPPAPQPPPELQAGAPPTEAKTAKAADIFPLEGEKQAPAAPPKPGADETQPVSTGQQTAIPPVPGKEKGPEPGTAAAAELGRERAAPVVRRRARELGVDLGGVRGSGPDGRILLQDLERLGKGAPAAPAAQAAPPEPEAPPRPQERPRPAGPQLVQQLKPMSRLRAAVAKTVTESWDKIPHFTVTMEILMDEADSVRRQLKQSGLQVSVNDLIVKAAALALAQYPQMNASYAADALQFHGEVNISIAVGVPDGVLMPVLTGCQRRTLLEIAEEARKLVERARAGTLGEQEMSGGTFSISNLGMFQVSSFSAVIHPAQSAVLAVGALTDAPMVRSGMLATGKVMKVTLSADHRVVDGAYAAQFLVALKETLENPVRLLL